MTTPLDEMRQDLEAEQAALVALVTPLPPAAWETPTPSEGWAVRDHIAHLAFFDEVATLAIVDAAGFARDLATAMADFAGYEARYLARGRAMAPAALLGWWRGTRRALLDAARGLDPKARLPWYGPPMSPLSFLGARLMETWAHGHDVADALGLARAETDRVRHIAFIGVRTRAHSYAIRGLEVPAAPVRVELTLPSGAAWAEGDATAADRISGPAVDFCRVVTHKRHVDDTSLTVVGPAAREWMRLAQAFAGPLAPGRKPGQFPADRRAP